MSSNVRVVGAVVARGAWVIALAAGLGCTRAPQPVATDLAQVAASDGPQTVAAATPSPAADGARSAEALRRPSQGYTLPAGCVPPGKRFACNPLSNAGCYRDNGEACDDDTKGGFTCYPPPNEVGEGGDCNDKEGPSCAAGLSCDTPGESNPNGLCRKLCCSAADCGNSKRCLPVDPEYGSFGFCK